MKRYGNLYERLVDPANIMAALLDAAEGKRDRRSVRRCLADPESTVRATIEIIGRGLEPCTPTPMRRWDESRRKWREIC